MKRISNICCALAASFCLAGQAVGQTVSVNTGNISFAYAKAQVGEMTFDAGETLTILGRTYNINDISSITVDDEQNVADNTVNVSFDGGEAKVLVAGNLAADLSITIKGANVRILANSNITDPITYTLTGNSQQGSFYMDGEANAKVVIDNLTLASPDSAAIRIEDGKQIELTLVGNSLLADGAEGTQPACLYINGHAIISGDGQLTLSGTARHAYCSDEYTLMQGGTMNITGAVNDGMHVNEFFQMDGGTINITSQGDGIDVGKKAKSTHELNGQMVVNNGSISANSTGVDANGASTTGKAIKAESHITINGGTVTAKASGASVFDTALSDMSSSSALKTDGNFVMTDGTLTLTNDCNGGRGLNATGNVTISGGKTTIVTMGERYKYDSTYDAKPQGMKSDGNISITGGKVYVAVAAPKATTFKTDFLFTINGATVVGIGGKNVVPSTGSQAYTATTGSFAASETVTIGETTYDFALPTGFSCSNAYVLVSNP